MFPKDKSWVIIYVKEEKYMRINKKAAIGILIFFSIIFLIIHYSTTYTYPESWLSVIRWVLSSLVVLPGVALPILTFVRKARESKLFPHLGALTIIYYAFILMLIAINTNLLPIEIPLFNSNTFAIAIALIALGISFLPKETQETVLPQNQAKIATLNKKLDEAEKTIDAFLEGSKKLGERLTAIQKGRNTR